MRQINQTYDIKAPLGSVWAALTQASVAEEWGAGPATVAARKGGAFSYWNGDIHGVFTKIIPEKLIEQDWYEHDYPERLHKVTFTFETYADNATRLHLLQTNVGEDEFASMADGWSEYYFEPIKQLLEIR